MNSESLGLFFFGQSQPERRSKATKLESAASHTPGEGRCVKGVCEVAWKPNQQNSRRDGDQSESTGRGD